MWLCCKCHEEVDDDFDVCWNCQTGRDGTPSKKYFARPRTAKPVPPNPSVRVFFPGATLRHDGACEICKGSGPAAKYRYHQPVTSEIVEETAIKTVRKRTYSSQDYVEVLICDQCVTKKRKQALLWYTLGLVLSIALTPFFFGIFGVILCGSALLKLRTREETGDVLAFSWFEHGTYQFAWMQMSPCLTRRQFASPW